MKTVLLVVATVVALLCRFRGALADGSKSYKGAVVTFTPVGDPSSSAASNLDLNLLGIEEVIQDKLIDGGGDDDIVVLPELVFYYVGLERALRDGKDALREYALALSPLGTNPCLSRHVWQGKQNGEFLSRLSCTARTLGSYLVANVLEVVVEAEGEEKYKLFNTDVAFDRSGALVAKYWKWHTFGLDSLIDEPDAKERSPSSFETDFGVTFGLFICFDIEFENPTQVLLDRGVSHFAYSSAWVNNPPFGFATEIQQGWSRATGAALLAANIGTDPSRSGSGIFFEGKELASDFDVNSARADRIISAEIPKRVGQRRPADEGYDGPLSSEASGVDHLALDGQSQTCTLDFLAGVALNASCVPMEDSEGPAKYTLAGDDLECSLTVANSTFGSESFGVPTLVAFSEIIRFPGTVEAVNYKGCILLLCSDFPRCSSPHWHALGKLGSAEIIGTFDGVSQRAIPLFSGVDEEKQNVFSREVGQYSTGQGRGGSQTIVRVANVEDRGGTSTLNFGIISVKEEHKNSF
ncbi:carbon-nitrogen hydrolase [Chloropicon primus]|nr:carbon-nitrogen hydrolase [Chloropicon primus]